MANDIFEGDVTSRYQETREPGRYSWQEAETDLTRDVFERPNETVAGLAWNFGQTHVDKVANLLAMGDFASAKESYDRMREDIRLNWDGLSTMAQMTQDGYGEMSAQLGDRSRRILSGEFNQRRVKLSDGTEVTLGQALADDSPFLSGKSDELSRFGFGANATDLYLKNDKVIKSVMDPLLRASHGGQPVQNRLQMIELAEDYANNAQRVADTFGDGSQRFMDYLQDTHRTSGNGARTFRTLLSFAEDYAAKTGITGKQLASDVVNGYNDLVAYAFKGDQKPGKSGMPPEITDDQRRLFDATLLPALTETMKGLDDRTAIDLHDPRMKQSLLEVMDTVAYASSHGVNILSDSRNAGYDVNAAFGGYVRNALLDREQPSDNIVEGVRRLRSDLESRITGGRSPQRIAASLSGRTEDFLSVDRRTGSQSLCPEADGMADTIHGFLVKELTPDMANGRLYSDAAASRSPELVDGLAMKLARSFYGPGRDLAAQAVASAALVGAQAADGSVVTRGFLNGGNVNVEELVAALAFAPDADANDPAIRSLRTWYNGNVALDLQFGERKARLRESLMSDGLSDAQARQIVSSASSRAAGNLARGIDPSFVFDNAEAQGMYLDIVKGEDGKAIVDYRFGNRERASVQYGEGDKDVLPPGQFLQNRAVWNQAQGRLSALMKRQERLADFERRQQIKNAGKGEDALD